MDGVSIAIFKNETKGAIWNVAGEPDYSYL